MAKSYNVLVYLPLYIDVEAENKNEAQNNALELVDEYLEISTITPIVQSVKLNK